ncbi:prepilin peptidase [Thalassobacillus devorans]|uniref:prepilin peptidase n=1 Tax=Thalassobacillus devorans TaxID=279813 RepID=UPI000491DF08|nr:A24 family peptidase [Thalassobacillus devorans]
MNFIFIVYFFIIGLVFGSFFNVVGFRIPKQTLLQHQRSHCPSCGNQLSWQDLIPVLSYLHLKGRCRYCRTSISIIYPFVELFTGSLFAYSYYIFGSTVELFTVLLLISLFSIIFVSDMTYMYIPDKVLITFFSLFFVLRMLHPTITWSNAFLGGISGIFLIGMIILLSKGGMGAGDMKLFGIIGFAMGIEGMMVSFFLAVISGACLSMAFLVSGKVARKQPIPFGPFIIFGTLTAYFYSDKILTWYIAFF